jgi:hypothetical protein
MSSGRNPGELIAATSREDRRRMLLGPKQHPVSKAGDGQRATVLWAAVTRVQTRNGVRA